MDPLLVVAGAAVVAFDAYAYRIYSQGRASLESAYSSSERAFRVKRHFDADQEPAKASARGDSATVQRKASGAPAMEIHVPFKPGAASDTAYAESALATSELAFLRGQVETLNRRLEAAEGQRAQAGGRPRFSAGEIDAKQAELHRMFMRRQISDDTYRTMCAEIAKVRLGL